MRSILFRSAFCALLLGSMTTASAEDYVLDIGDEVRLDGVGGGWGRAFPAGDGDWHYLFGGAGDYRHMALSSDFQFSFNQVTSLTGRVDLIDHAIAKCPDGTYLHLASGEVVVPDDSAWGFRYDSEWNLIAQADVDVSNPDYQHNDLPVLCSTAVDMVVFQPRIDAEAAVVMLDADLNPISHNLTMSPVPPVPGSSLYYDSDSNTIVRLTAPEIESEDATPRNKLIVFRIYWDQDEPYEVKTEIDMTAAGIGSDWHAYWPQGLLRVGDFYFVSHMARPVDGGFNQDDGNLYLEVFDENFNLVETHQLTDDAGPEANQRPSLALQNDILLVTYDKRISNNLQNFVMKIQLDMDAIGEGSPNLGPTAYAGADFSGAIGALANLDGSASSDPDNDAMDYSWSFLSVPDGSALTEEDLVNRFTDAPSFVPDVVGDFEIELSVFDSESSDTDEVVVSVIDNLAPVPNAGEDSKAAMGDNVLLDGSASVDPDGDALSYLWYFESFPETSALSDESIAAATSAVAAFSPDVDGTYVVVLEVTDGNFTETDTVEIIVGAGGCACTSAPSRGGLLGWGGLLFGLALFRRKKI
jgi:hypothetical protein